VQEYITPNSQKKKKHHQTLNAEDLYRQRRPSYIHQDRGKLKIYLVSGVSLCLSFEGTTALDSTVVVSAAFMPNLELEMHLSIQSDSNRKPSQAARLTDSTTKKLKLFLQDLS
jgi:hypothetical protein